MVIGSNGLRHVLVANSVEQVESILQEADVGRKDIYELKSDTFKDSGFIISDPPKEAEAFILTEVYSRLRVMRSDTEEVVAEITNSEVIPANGYLVKLTPKYD